MIITTLVDNTRLDNRQDLAVERGLSLHIETESLNILFDMGRGNTFCKNAHLLGVDIGCIDVAVISHRHHDHCNGAMDFISHNSKAKIYLKNSEEKHYYFCAYGFKSNVGVNTDLLNYGNARLVFLDQATEIATNVFIITDISTKHEKPKGNRYLYTQSKNCFEHDSFEHELLLVIKECDGLVIFTGCAHSGVINMIDTAATHFPGERIKAVVGGFHLVGLPLLDSIGGTKQDIKDLGLALLQYPIDKLYTGHCTGKKAYALLKEILRDRLEEIPTGRRVSI
ncbi:MBL fold metallo-hydrolase [Plesiomonas shigelloides]|uniref:MBL fold metallo-hydrolase n=1 Tax=Plesiomonas shigelloides TaxID=703 RepID=A0A8I2B5V9_PLESH|nr:MBL fold metallo-hydrolase [Plesiomonas shigelloides]KAB7681708.1 MBL fold metallo-hydrolase [Plesiomonas shigelloides]MBO1109375.1 MBL fold metallo-hydrolase [Plesiomonas shigelloides]MCX9457483.1 MBL fold metallo-hydrolase [Vibrio cholerae]